MSIDPNRTRSGPNRRRSARVAGAVLVAATLALAVGSGAGATASRQASTPSAEEQEQIVAAALAPIGVTILPADFPRGFEPDTSATFTAAGGNVQARLHDLGVWFSELPTRVQTGMLVSGDLGATATALAAEG